MPPATRSATATRKPTAKPTAKSKSKPAAKPKGVQKPARQPRKKVTQADIDALAPLAWPLPNYTYLELQPPDEDDVEENGGYVERYLKKLKKNYNGSEVKISEDAYERLMNMYIEVEKRTPESNGIVHIFEDYRGLGVMEVIENQIADYVKELKRANPCEFKLFQIAEALAFFLDGAYDNVWFNVDDGEGVESLVNLIGALFADAFRRLDVDNHPMACLMSPPELSPLKNLGLVMGMAVAFGEGWNDLVGEEEKMWWQRETLRMARVRGVVVRDAKGVVESEGEEKWQKEKEAEVEFMVRVAAYKQGGKKLGGSYYDLTKKVIRRR